MCNANIGFSFKNFKPLFIKKYFRRNVDDFKGKVLEILEKNT
jgi:hypothetical protein